MKLGDIAKDKISGFSGLITAKATYIYNIDRFCLTPMEIKDNEPAKGVWFDENQLEIVSIDKMEATPLIEHSFKMNDKVKDIHSTYTGVVVGIVTFLNGCIRLEIASSTIEKGLPVDNAWIDVRAAKLIYEAPTVPEFKKTGGPMRDFKSPKNPR